MLKEFKVYIVNLKHNTERKEHILTELKKQNIKNFQIIDAVDGKKLQDKDLKNFTCSSEKKYNS